MAIAAVRTLYEPGELPSFRGSQAMMRLMAYDDVKTVLDVGSGSGEHATYMRQAGKEVTTVSLAPPADIVGDFMAAPIKAGYDAIWASHVLEHQPDVSRFLFRCWSLLRTGGVMVVTVPPYKPNVVGGHLTTWNAGLLLYNLIVAGFDCREARVSGCYSSGDDPTGKPYPPYNLSVIVRKRAANLPQLHCDSGDISRLAEFFPLPVTDGFDGRLPAIRW